MLGSNVPTIGGFHTGFRYGDEWGCKCIQIYVTLSRKWDVPKLSREEVIKFETAWRKSSVKQVVAHVPFLVNLASPNEEIWEKSMRRLITEVYRANKFGVQFLVLHPGSYGDSNRKEGLKKIITSLNTISQRMHNTSTKILLETMAGQGTMIGSCFEEINQILQEIKAQELFGVCFDTGHVFMAGYDIRGYKGYENVLKKFDKIIGLDKLMVSHLNDSKTKLGTRSDRHACIGEGELGLQFFHALLRDQRFSGIPKVLEIPERDKRSKDNLEFLRKLRAISDPLPGEKRGSTQLTFKGVN